MIQNQYAMFYARFVSNKKKSYEQSGVFLGCIGSDVEEIKNMGRNIASSDDNMIICKIFKLCDSIDSLSIDALEYFENFGNSLNNVKD